MSVLERLEVPEDVGDIRLDAWLTARCARFPSRASARKAIKRGEVLLEGEPARSGWFLRPGQQVEVCERSGPPPPVYRTPQPVRVVYEDAVMAVVEKPPGLRINGNQLATLEHALPAWLEPATTPDALRVPRPAHRLDQPTGGLVAVGKTSTALMGLSGAFERREVHKEYRAITVGHLLPEEGEMDDPIDGRTAHTRYQVLEVSRALKSDWISTVALFPTTGRQHQLRRHLADRGCPILGDKAYGQEGLILFGKGLFLWAVALELPHPLTGERMRVAIDAPPKFAALREREARRWRKYHP